jgi:hypothetical protein
MSGEIASGANSWTGDENNSEENDEVNAEANSWSDDENEAPVQVENGGDSAPGTAVKEMPKRNTWRNERSVPAPESVGVIAELSKWNPFATKATASVASVAVPEETAVPMTPMPPPKNHKSILSPGGNSSGPVSRFNLGSPNIKGGSRKRKSRAKKSRKSRFRKNRKTQRKRRNHR